MLRVSLVGDYVAEPFGRFVGVLKSVPGQFYELWNDRTMFSAFEHFVMLGAAAFVFFTGLAILFFVLLPLAAQPGPNKPCVKHTLRGASEHGVDSCVEPDYFGDVSGADRVSLFAESGELHFAGDDCFEFADAVDAGIAFGGGAAGLSHG